MAVQTLIGIKPHAIGGDSHSASTLGALNAKISDATLDDSGDPRDPNAHASTHLPSGSDSLTTAAAGAIEVGDSAAVGSAESFARSDHQHSLAAPAAPADVTKAAASAGSSSNVARQDHKHDISTAAPTTAIGTDTVNAEGSATTLARSDHSHEVNVPNNAVTSTTTFTTTSTTDTIITGMSITPGAGTYLVLFSAAATGDGGPKNGYFSIYANGVQQAHSERRANDTKERTGSTQAIATVSAGQAIEARGRGDDTLIIYGRSLVLVRLG